MSVHGTWRNTTAMVIFPYSFNQGLSPRRPGELHGAESRDIHVFCQGMINTSHSFSINLEITRAERVDRAFRPNHSERPA
jgi:hypothetical protein